MAFLVNLSPFNGVSLPHFAVAEILRWAWSENRSVARMNGLEAEAHAVAPSIDCCQVHFPDGIRSTNETVVTPETTTKSEAPTFPIILASPVL